MTKDDRRFNLLGNDFFSCTFILFFVRILGFGVFVNGVWFISANVNRLRHVSDREENLPESA